MHASRTLFIGTLAAVANAALPAHGSALSNLPGLPKAPGLSKPSTARTPPKTSGGDEAACTYDGTDDGKFDYSAVSLREVGARNTLDWRIWLLHKCKPISFWHDVCLHFRIPLAKMDLITTLMFCSLHSQVPLYPFANDTTIINAVVEIPRWTDGKIEIESEEPLTPIFHDDRKGAPRFVESVWPHRSYPFVYGSVSLPTTFLRDDPSTDILQIPQTWENPNVNHTFVNEPGDNDPIDFFDIGQDPGYFGQIRQSKVLGGIAPNDGGETDWKILVIDINDPIAPFVNTVADVEKYRPGVTQAFYDWFQYYKVARGDDVIPIVGNAYQNASYITEHVLPQGYEWWVDLIAGRIDPDGLAINQTSFEEFESYVAPSETEEVFEIPSENDVQPAAAKPTEYDEWYYLDEDFQLIQQGE
jgi:inorganic pyrophosphatase